MPARARRDTAPKPRRLKRTVLFDDSGRPGLGAGLCMVPPFAGEMGHGLHVETAPGRGSTFSLILPVAEKSAADSPRRKSAAP